MAVSCRDSVWTCGLPASVTVYPRLVVRHGSPPAKVKNPEGRLGNGAYFPRGIDLGAVVGLR